MSESSEAPSAEWEPEDYPVSDYYEGNVIAGKTLSKTGQWWSAMLVIQHPETGERHVGLYRWQKRDGDWKRAKNYTINSKDRLNEVVDSLNALVKLIE